jgi:hypothetical protein
MSDRRIAEISRHHLRHILNLRVDPLLFEATFEHACSMQNCDATCCQHGVMVDVLERDNILGHAGLIRRYMSVGQEGDPQRWFDAEGEMDTDFPSGEAVGTTSDEKGCVFLKDDGRCVLQVAAEGEGMPRQALKPFYCFAYPITVESGVLAVDDPDFTNRTDCCSMIPGGSKSVIDVCRFELEFVLGEDGLEELFALRSKEKKSMA